MQVINTMFNMYPETMDTVVPELSPEEKDLIFHSRISKEYVRKMVDIDPTTGKPKSASFDRCYDKTNLVLKNGDPRGKEINGREGREEGKKREKKKNKYN